jgi:hypothetical protein
MKKLKIRFIKLFQTYITMANLAIKGHPTRGKEVIEILKMLGGKIRRDRLAGNELFSWYYINGNGYIDYKHYSLFNDTTVFTLEQFEEKFPYKIGDEVKNARINDFIGRITNVRWDGNEKQIIYTVEWDDVTKSTLTYFARGLQPYKEQTMEGVYAYNEINCYHQDFSDKVRIRLGNDYEIKVEDKVTYIVKKQSQYPKTYEECCEIIGYEPDRQTVTGYDAELIENLQTLKLCRDAYWKIAGEQMGLGKPWEPNWENKENCKYGITTINGQIKTISTDVFNYLLIFPTIEMRDAFYENFKELIETCKELL